MNALNGVSKTTAAFFVQAAAAFGVSFLGALGGIYFLRSTRGSGCSWR
jgi:hypothetical protein